MLQFVVCWPRHDFRASRLVDQPSAPISVLAAVRYGTTQHNMTQHKTWQQQHKAMQPNAAQQNTTNNNTEQHNTDADTDEDTDTDTDGAQHCTKQQNTIQGKITHHSTTKGRHKHSNHQN